MGQPSSARRHLRSIGASLLLLAGLPGCAYFLPGGPTPAPSLSQEQLDARIGAELDAVIARSLPDVSYQSQNPAMTDPLGKLDPSLIMRKVETLDGAGSIVCRKQAQTVFGECVFPPPVAP